MSQAPAPDLVDPADHEAVARRLALLEFGWDTTQALSLALFRTFAVPTIGRLLDETAEFTERTQKRYDDTALLLEVPLVEGLDSERGRAAIRQVNGMHRRHDISDDDMRYTLATFVVVPRRWIDAHGKRRLTDDEVSATVGYYRALGARMGIRGIPQTYDGFAALMDAYEAEHFAFDPGGRRVADATLALMATFYPRALRPLVLRATRSMMDPPLLAALGYDEPHPLERRLVGAALRARGRVAGLLPARRRPAYVRDMPRIRSYPDGFTVEDLGTAPRGCPVRHRTTP